jgi:hypothetical protein
MISTVLADIKKNFAALPGMANVDFRPYPEAKEEQPGPRRILVYPLRSKGMGPDVVFSNAPPNSEIRQRYLVYEAQCWGVPDPNGSLINNTDDAENIMQSLIVAIRMTVTGTFRLLDEVWNNSGEVMMYGRCVTIHFDIRTPVPDIDITTELVQLGNPGFQLETV